MRSSQNFPSTHSGEILCPEVVRDTLNYYWLYSTGLPTYLFLASSEPPNSPASRDRLS
jgi:hypothetical protein